ncbi:hypothetical protein SAMN02745673_01432 [Marinactinospora thermotolerans DSM 45154]|uniref:ABC transporter n=1 Tax=Marinactinospora thermotolerans DSM 45154 TaxID=1122192 RepID=A0A1T4NFY6_9ACTN|nr:hypothetical protein [Marinactinospora thermotolerans]SJZ78281.1 hypothetical protein SAMN02745673_01432 [Marinactinospora thermotolerans DSM 45154]
MMFGNRSAIPPSTLVAALLLTAGCASAGQEAPPEAASPEATPHGYVEGAQEMAEPQWRLVMADTADGALYTLDPATEEVAEVGRAEGVREVATDGRFAYFGGAAGTAILDSGTWTVDHGDHSHYYVAETRLVGEVEAGAGLEVTGDLAVSTLSSDGGATVLDRPALEDGEITETAALDEEVALAYGGHLLVVDGDGVRLLDRAGEPVRATVEEDCPSPQGQAVTRRGAVLGCSDGALLVTEGEGEDAVPVVEKIPYPEDADAGPVESLEHRPGTPVLAGRAGDEGVWVLDIAAREWTLLDTGPTVAVSAAGEDMPVLVLGADGTLRSYDPATGEETAATELMEPPAEDAATAPVIRIDTARAYVNDPAAGAVHEIDYNDDLRLARTFEPGFTPDLMVETGW